MKKRLEKIVWITYGCSSIAFLVLLGILTGWQFMWAGILSIIICIPIVKVAINLASGIVGLTNSLA